MKRALFTLGCLFLASQAAAQAPSPAQMGITPTTTPEVLQVLDKNKVWVPLGSVDGHVFTPVGGGSGGGGGSGNEVDIVVTDSTIGMAPSLPGNLVDNSPHVSALMNKMGGPNKALSGYDVTFPALPGQMFTTYYFTQPFVMTRGARYHCSGTGLGSSTWIIFASGVDGFIQENSARTPDGGAGGGTIDGCTIVNMSFGSSVINPITPNTMTSVGFWGDPSGAVPSPIWQVGDGIILNTNNNKAVPYEAVPAAPIGTTITAVSGSVGAQTLTLSNPISPATGSTAAPHSTAVFTQTATNNFAANDAITVGLTTYTFKATIASQLAHSVLVGKDFDTSAANLVAAINGTIGQFVTYIPATTGPEGFSNNHIVTASYTAGSGVITFTSIYSGPAANQLASTAVTSAGTFGGALFTGANDVTTCPAPCTAQNVVGYYYQLPAAQAFTVNTTAGSPTMTITGGPRLLNNGDVIWSDAFPFGTTVEVVTGTLGAQTATMWGPTNLGVLQNAIQTETGGKMWVIPAAIKRRVQAGSFNNRFQNYPIGLQMSCSSNQPYNCDGSSDTNNTHIFHLVGRWVAGNNTGASISTNEEFSADFITDIFEGGSVGSTYVNPNPNNGENTGGLWPFITNCVNGNTSMIFGAYFGGSGNGCANMTSLYPPTPGGPSLLGVYKGGNNGAYLKSTTFGGLSGWNFIGGNDAQVCATFTGSPGGWYALGFNAKGCAVTTSELGLGWDALNNVWQWSLGNNAVPMKFLWAGQGYTGYAGIGTGAGFPTGVILAGDGNNNPANNARLFGATNFKPTANWHLRGDTEINTVQSPGGQAFWYYAPQFSTTLTAAVVKGTTTSVTVTACPTVAPPAGTLISDVSAFLSPNVNLGVYSSCTAGTLTFTAAALNNSWAANDAIQFLYPYPAGAISNDPNNPDYTATTIRSGSSANKDITGRITLAGGTATYTLTGVYATAPVCLTADATTPANASSVSESTTVLTFTGTGTDVIKYECVGRN